MHFGEMNIRINEVTCHTFMGVVLSIKQTWMILCLKRPLWTLRSVLSLTCVQQMMRKKLVDEGILDGWLDKDAFEEDARINLTHICNQRCKIRVGEGNGPENFRCKKIDTVLASKHCGDHEFMPIHYIFSKELNDLMQRLDMYQLPGVGVHIEGGYFHPILKPTRHIGKVHPGARDNMSPVCAS